MTTELSTGTVVGVFLIPLLWLLAVRMLIAPHAFSRRGRRGHRPDLRLDGDAARSRDIARLLAPAFEPEMVRFVTRTADRHGIAASTLWDFGRMFGPVMLAVAVAAHATEAELRSHLREGTILNLHDYLLFAAASGLAVDRSLIGLDAGRG